MSFLYRVHDTYRFQLSFESRRKKHPFHVTILLSKTDPPGYWTSRALAVGMRTRM
jgi:hypothetical protein